MSRYYAPISISELETKVVEAFSEGDGIDPYLVKDKLRKDLKVEFGFENFDMVGGKYMGYASVGDFTFLGLTACDDSEYPVYFIIYWDGKKLRGYVPTDGNPWDTTLKKAYGHNVEANGKNAHKRWPHLFDGSPAEIGDFDFDWAAIWGDIKARILPGKQAAKPAKKKSLRERIESLVLYGPGCETEELFAATCRLCYQMYGLGEEEHAETLYEWAKEQAEATRLDGYTDFVKGYWG